jgi:hypothetical protein
MLQLEGAQMLLRRPCDWIQFFHADMQHSWASVYTVPGSLPALRSRVNHNLTDFLVRFQTLHKPSTRNTALGDVITG